MNAATVRAKSLEWIYLCDRVNIFPLAKHRIWQAPLLFPEDISDLDEFDRRVRHAGELWLQNHDLRPFNLLIITHLAANRSYLFQRPQAPGQLGTSIGSIDRCLLTDGGSIGLYPIVFVEVKRSISIDIVTPEWINKLHNVGKISQ
jgi:hypothetical protein